MPAWIASCLLGAFAVLGLPCAANAQAGAVVGEAAPDFVLKSAGGSNLRLSEYRGEVVAVVFWASWCGECRERLEELERLVARYADTGFRTLAVSLDADRARAGRAAESMDVALPVLFDEAGDVGGVYAADSLPAVALVDRGGVLRGTFAGRERDVGLAIVERVRDLLRE